MVGSVFISYRVASELSLARFLFDELNHTVTPGGHRVTVYWDAHRLVKVGSTLGRASAAKRPGRTKRPT
jgi:hypothetical protein